MARARRSVRRRRARRRRLALRRRAPEADRRCRASTCPAAPGSSSRSTTRRCARIACRSRCTPPSVGSSPRRRSLRQHLRTSGGCDVDRRGRARELVVVHRPATRAPARRRWSRSPTSVSSTPGQRAGAGGSQDDRASGAVDRAVGRGELGADRRLQRLDGRRAWRCRTNGLRAPGRNPTRDAPIVAQTLSRFDGERDSTLGASHVDGLDRSRADGG